MRADRLHRNYRFRDPNHPDTDPCPVCEAEASTYPPAPAVRTVMVDGLEFEVPTWDPAPTPWNKSGSWAKDPDLTARLLAGILAAVPDFPRLAAEANRAKAVSTSWRCGTFWGSHGCDRERGHEGLCVCSPDLELGEPCSVGLKWGNSHTLIVAFNGETTPSTLHWGWFE